MGYESVGNISLDVHWKNVVSGLESGEHCFATPVVYQHGSSHISGGAIGSGMTESDRVRTRNRFPRFFLTIVVVQNVSLRITGSNMATGYDVTRSRDPKGVPWKGVRMSIRKLRNIRPSGAFSPEMTSSNATSRASPGKFGSANARPEV